MGRFGLAISVFFKTLGNADFAKSAEDLVQGKLRIEAKPTESQVEKKQPTAPKPEPTPKPLRSDAITLLGALQREGRLIDFLMEDIGAYEDAQIGAAAREVHHGAASVVKRMFDIQPLREEAEEATITVPEGFDTGQIQLVGKVDGKPPFEGTLMHHGWVAKQVNLPAWQGDKASCNVVSPAEVELR